MKTFEKDVMLICKGSYSDNYENSFEAIKAYQAQYTGMLSENLTDEMVLDYLFYVIKAIFSTEDYFEMLKEKMARDFCLNNEFEMSYRNLANLFIRQLESVRVRENGKWLIDLSDYEGPELII